MARSASVVSRCLHRVHGRGRLVLDDVVRMGVEPQQLRSFGPQHRHVAGKRQGGELACLTTLHRRVEDAPARRGAGESFQHRLPGGEHQGHEVPGVVPGIAGSVARRG
jgi:hypothetical protein